MKFRCNLCSADPEVPTYHVTAHEFDEGMKAMQQHVDTFHDVGLEAVVQDVTLNVRVKVKESRIFVIYELTTYQFNCDAPDCDTTGIAHDRNLRGALEQAKFSGWTSAPNGAGSANHFCPEHGLQSKVS